MSLAVRARRVQQVFETILVASIFFTLVFLVLRASLRNETVPKISTCTDTEEHPLSYGSNGLAQRLFQYYFLLRLDPNADFVFCPTSFYSALIKLGWVTRGRALEQLQRAAQLPCEIKEDVMHNSSETKCFVMMTDWRKRPHDDFLWALDVRREEVLSNRHKFHQSVSSRDGERAAVMSKNQVSFKCQYEDLDFAFATRFILDVDEGNASERQNPVGDITAKGFILDVPNSCTRLLKVHTRLEGFVVIFILPRPRGQCNFEKLLKDFRTQHLNEALQHNLTTEVFIRFAPLTVTTRLKLTAALQSFNAIRIFYKDQAEFDGVLTPHSVGLSAREVEHETAANLDADAFFAAQFPGDNPEIDEREIKDVLIDIVGKEHLFLLVNVNNNEAVLFGKRIERKLDN